MSIESMFSSSHARSNRRQALLASLPCYVRRLVVVFILVPAALPGIGLAMLNHGSFTGMATTLLEQAAGTGTSPDTIRVESCADPALHHSPSSICTHKRTDDVSIATLAPQLGRGLFTVWFFVATVLLVLDLIYSRSSPLGLRRRLDWIGRRRAEQSRANGEGEAK